MRKQIVLLVILLNITNMYAQSEKEIQSSDRYVRGWEKLKEIDGQAGENVIKSLEDFSPELARFIIEYSFGDVYTMNSLDNKSKEIATVASLITLGTIPQLKVHLNGALNTGCTVDEVKEIIVQMSVYAGFPKSINAMNALKEVLKERQDKAILDKEGLK